MEHTGASPILLWLLTVNLGIAFGAGLYEHRVVVPHWITYAPDCGAHWHAEVARRDNTGRQFWAFVTTLPLTLITLANLFAAWHAPGAARGWWLAAGLAAFTDRAFTFAYFIPTLVGLMGAADSPAAAATATQWWNLNYVRLAILLAAWLASLRTFALLHQHG